MLATVSSLYGSLAALLLVALSFRVTKLRRSLGVGLGDSGNQTILQAMRVQSNFVEYAAVSLLLLLFLELNLLDQQWLHAFGSVFLIARLLHVWGFGRKTGYSRGRFFGTLLTWLNLIAMALVNVFLLLTVI